MEKFDNLPMEAILFRRKLRKDLEEEINNALNECEKRKFGSFERGLMIQMTLSVFFQSYDVIKAQAIMDELDINIDMAELIKSEYEAACVKYLC